MKHLEEIQDAKCTIQNTRTGRRSDTASLGLDDNGTEDSCELFAFVPKPLDLGLRFELKRDTEAQPVDAFPRLSEGILNFDLL